MIETFRRVIMDDAHSDDARTAGVWLWIAFVVVASLALSRAFACATPFAGVAAAAAMTLPRRHAAALVLLVWLGNQAIGFGLLHYPPTASTAGWGGAIGLAALCALGAASIIGRPTKAGSVFLAAFALLAAYAIYEAVLFAATAVLPSGSAAFAPMVVVRLLGINAAGLGLLLAVHRLAQVAGLPSLRTAPPQSG